MSTINVVVRHGRYTNELCVVGDVCDAAALESIAAALREKKFPAEVKHFEFTKKIAVTVAKLRSDRASDYAESIVRRAGRAAGLFFLSTDHR